MDPGVGGFTPECSRVIPGATRTRSGSTTEQELLLLRIVRKNFNLKVKPNMNVCMTIQCKMHSAHVYHLYGRHSTHKVSILMYSGTYSLAFVVNK